MECVIGRIHGTTQRGGHVQVALNSHTFTEPNEEGFIYVYSIETLTPSAGPSIGGTPVIINFVL